MGKSIWAKARDGGHDEPGTEKRAKIKVAQWVNVGDSRFLLQNYYFYL